MQNADYLIGEVLKEGLVGDVATAIGTGVAAKAAHNVVKKAIPLAIQAAKSPMARAAGRAAMTAASVAAPGVGRLAIKAAPILAGAYVAHKINQSSGSGSH